MKINTLLWSLMVIGLLAACKKDSDEPLVDVDPADANALTSVLIMPDGTDNDGGDAPAPTGETEAPTVTGNATVITSSNGATAPLNFVYGNVNGNLGGCYVQVAGADSYFTVPYNDNSSSSGNLQLPIGIPTNVLEGDFSVNFCVYDTDGRISNVITTQINVLRLGTGALQISLSWDTPTDQDLYVTDPSGFTIYYGDTYSLDTDGQLDRDDLDGFGPENIFWTEDAPDGTYVVQVNDFDGTVGVNNFYVTVSAPGVSRRFTGTTQAGSTTDVVTFTKDGDDINF